ncbi:HEPN domain-containing protein [Paenisporosarcina indica]|uniref:HEPN domain-containing protein n=1 Tax=Paenisporosarcina indica TaxID=650093 RepID=UPI00094F9321|nr:HEPN domain-containing protein [Paenisporosarcina indica]
MTIKTIAATCFYPLIQLSEEKIIKEIQIDIHNNVTVITGKMPNKVVANRLLHPNEFSDVEKILKEARTIIIEKKFKENDDKNPKNDTISAISDIEDFVSWCSYLMLQECRILHWGDVHSEPITRNGRIVLSVGRQFNIPTDTSPINEAGEFSESHKIESSTTINHLGKWMKIKIPNEYKSILRWYRKGTLSYFPEEKIIFWITALELISKLTSEETEIKNTCEKCGHINVTRPSVNKKALFDYISELGFSKNKTFNVIQKYRNKYAHGGKESFQYFSEEIRLVTAAAFSLLVLFLSKSLNEQEKFPFQDKSIPQLFNHPLIGDVSFLIEAIKELENSGLHKKSKQE